MSTTRSLTEKFANHSQLNDVNPTKSLLICAMPCEVRAAEIYNSTVASIKAEDTHSIALHYLKNGMGKNLSFAKTSTCVLLLLVLMVNQAFLYKNRADNLNEDNHTIDFDFLMFVFFTFALSANLLPNLANTFRYQKAQTACEAWLEQRLSNKCFNEIKKLSTHRESYFKINHLLYDHKNDVDEASNKKMTKK